MTCAWLRDAWVTYHATRHRHAHSLHPAHPLPEALRNGGMREDDDFKTAVCFLVRPEMWQDLGLEPRQEAIPPMLRGQFRLDRCDLFLIAYCSATAHKLAMCVGSFC